MSSPLAKLPPIGEERRDIEKRFWAKVDRRTPDECWPWLASCTRYGYGQFRLSYSTVRAHRVAWWLTHGAIPEGMCVLHTCDNPGCVSPEHLFLGTKADNMSDRNRKGRQARGAALPQSKLTEEDVRAIREEYATTSLSQKELGRKYGIAHPTVSGIVSRRRWRHVK